MSPYYLLFLSLLPLLILLLSERQTRKHAVQMHRVYKKHHPMEVMKLQELAQRFIGHDCLIYTVNGQCDGTIREVSGNAVLLEKGGSTEAVNLEYVLRIRDYPLTSKGKRKTIVAD